jgi:hypothetical protein
MESHGRGYRYVGPAGLPQEVVRSGEEGQVVSSRAHFDRWVSVRTATELTEPFTFVVGLDGLLRLAPRRSEHVACAGGAPVLSAGEMSFRRERKRGHWSVDEVSNLSTGYCPDVTSWPSVAHALDLAGIGRPEGFTYEVVFRRCESCQERAVVRESDFYCVFCGGALPLTWNVDPLGG